MLADSTVVSDIPQSYTVVPVGQDIGFFGSALNNAGQLAYSRWNPVLALNESFFYDGATTHKLPSFGGSVQTYGINNAGIVVGNSCADSGCSNRKAFFWKPGESSLTPVGEPGQGGVAVAINDNGEIAGATTVNERPKAFIWSQSVGTRILPDLTPDFPGTEASSVSDLNAIGSISGQSDGRSVVWINGSIRTITPGFRPYDLAGKINNRNQVIGSAAKRAFYWDSVRGFDHLGWGYYSSASDINENGMVVGHSGPFEDSPFADRRYHALTLLNGSLSDISDAGFFNAAASVNNSNIVVGQATDANNYRYSFIWSSSRGRIDLDKLLTNAPPGFHIDYPITITDTGYILASANSGAVLLKPVATGNVPPVVAPITSSDPVAINTPMNLSASFKDADVTDKHTAEWDWGDGSPKQRGSLTETNGSGSVSNVHVYKASGIFNATLTVTDSEGKSTSVSKPVVVYDPNAGFVTGGGWIDSPAGASKAEPTIAGRATFGFVSKYVKGATAPSGDTDFVFKGAKLNFHSKNYDWLVIAGARAQYKGTGTLNGQTDFKFLLTAVDGDLIGKGKPDRFRIKIWHSDKDGNEIIDYDNQIDDSVIGSNSEGTVISGGSVVIHK